MKIKCPACASVLNIPDSAAGKVVKCPCGKQLRAPGGSPAVPNQPPATPAATSQPAAASERRATPQRPVAPRPVTGDFDPAMFDELTDQDLEPVRAVMRPGMEKPPTDTGGRLLQQYGAGAGGADNSRSGGRRPMHAASVGKRIVGAIVDGLIPIGSFFLVAVIVGLVLPPMRDTSDIAKVVVVVIAVLVASVPVIFNIVLISRTGQSIGKKVMGTIMVNQDSGIPVGFVHGFLIRQVAFGFISGLPIIGFFVAIADLVYLFIDPNHQTLHDKLASTMVVDF